MQHTFPLPIYETASLGRMTGRDGREFEILAGLDRDVVEQLRAKSLDETDTEIQRNTSDRERFGEGSYEVWYKKDRTPFALVTSDTRELAALVWFGPKPLGRKSLKHLSAEEKAQDERAMDAGEWHTIVYRSYPPFRGTGIMKQFTTTALEAYRSAFPRARFWAGIHAENPASIGFAQSLGFVIDEARSDPAHHYHVMTMDA